MESKIIFITGGARSGKTGFAESYAEKLSKKNKRSLYYIATSTAKDKEMEERIKRHQIDRQKSNRYWQTIEQAVNIGESSDKVDNQSIALVDCITLLLTNELYQGDFNEELFKKNEYQKQVKKRILDGLLKLSKKTSNLFIVSNEVLYDRLKLNNKIVLIYQKLLGEIHQELVRMSDEVYLLEFKIAIRKK